MIKIRAKKYCIAAGCRNNDKNSNQSFFFVPTRQKDAERARKWLTLLGREDLLEKKDLKKFTYPVCSAHFDASSIKILKHLKEDAVPTMLLADQPSTSCLEAQPESAQFKDTGVSSYSITTPTPSGCAQINEKRNNETQTDSKPLPEQQTQTSKLLTEGTPRKIRECKCKQRKMPRVYCVVYGCLNSASSKPELSFFKLPAGVERRSKWLTLICREDLIEKPPHSYAVCQDHFDPIDVLPGAHRNKLKAIALPSRKLPVAIKREMEDPLADPDDNPGPSHPVGTMENSTKDGAAVVTPRVSPGAQKDTQTTPEASSPTPAKKAKLTPSKPTSSILWNTLRQPKRVSDSHPGNRILAAATTIREPSTVCCVFGCRSNDLEHLEKKFFDFPKDQMIISQWLRLFNRKDLEGKLRGVADSKICSDHFDEADYIQGDLSQDAVPRHHLPKRSANLVFASYTAPSEIQMIPEVKIEREDEMEVELHFEPEAPPTATFNERVLTPTVQTVGSPSVTQSRPLQLVVSPMNAAGTIETLMPNIVKVESYNDLAPAYLKKKLKEAFLKKATICAVEQINLMPTPPFSASVHVQTTKQLVDLMNAPMVKKFKEEINELKRKIKQYERQIQNPKMDKKKFMETCDKYMDEKIANIVKAHACFNDKSVGNRYTRSFKAFAINLYLCSPQSYRFVEQFFCLPSLNTIKRFQVPVRTGVNNHLIDALKVKVNEMSEKEKICTVCFDYMEVNKNLFYDVTNDALCGIQDIDQVLGSEPAKYAVLIMVRGLFTKWKQPVSFGFVSHKVCNPLLKEWLYRIISILFDIGLNIKAFASDMETEFLDLSDVSATEPYFEVCGRKIYHIFDVPSLFKSARDDLMQYNFHIGPKVVKWSHILEVYEADKEEDLRLMPKITKNHVKPNKESKTDAKLAIQLFSHTVAAALNFHVIANMVNEKTKDTIDFIATMNNLFDILNSPRVSNGNELKQTYKGTTQQVKFLLETLEYLQMLEIKDKSGNAVQKRMTFVTGLVITIKSVMSLLDDLNKVYLKQIATKRLSKDCMDVYFRRVREMVGNSCARPTSIMFARCFRRLFLINLVSDAKKGVTDIDLKTTLSKISDYVKSDLIKEEQDHSKSLRVGVSDHHLLWPIPSTSFITGYLIWKCIEKHTCQKMVDSLCIDCNLEASTELLLNKFKVFNPANMNSKDLPEPPQFIVEFVDKLDAIYNDYYRSGDMQPFSFGWNVYLAMENETFDLPCECFPLKFFKMFFIRLKIFHTVKEFNRNNRPRRRQRV